MRVARRSTTALRRLDQNRDRILRRIFVPVPGRSPFPIPGPSRRSNPGDRRLRIRSTVLFPILCSGPCPSGLFHPFQAFLTPPFPLPDVSSFHPVKVLSPPIPPLAGAVCSASLGTAAPRSQPKTSTTTAAEAPSSAQAQTTAPTAKKARSAASPSSGSLAHPHGSHSVKSRHVKHLLSQPYGAPPRCR
jgi:pyruvate/2-oxoglutarate dehydrogenase complex dihydrolipoamide acyltransferase (E2) component